MKRTAAVLFLIAANAAQARPVWVYPPTETVRWWSPPETVVDANDQRWQDPSAAKMESCGWVICEIGEAAVDDCVVDFASIQPVRAMTPQEMADRQAERDAAEAAAAAEARMPAQFENGIAVKDANGHWMQLMPVTNAAPTVMLQVSESPMEAKKHDAMLASNSAVWSAKFDKAKSGTKGQTQDRLSNIESLFGAAP